MMSELIIFKKKKNDIRRKSYRERRIRVETDDLKRKNGSYSQTSIIDCESVHVARRVPTTPPLTFPIRQRQVLDLLRFARLDLTLLCPGCILSFCDHWNSRLLCKCQHFECGSGKGRSRLIETPLVYKPNSGIGRDLRDSAVLGAYSHRWDLVFGDIIRNYKGEQAIADGFRLDQPDRCLQREIALAWAQGLLQEKRWRQDCHK